ncbi:MAG TPA: hypothetical protein VFN50_07755, partial [Acidimicrobiales bacterium]|nr:hypothetical protein [Acidimicrobiales bacterium]
ALLALQGAAGGVTAVVEARAGAADVHLALGTLLWLAASVLAFGGGTPRRALPETGQHQPLVAAGAPGAAR